MTSVEARKTQKLSIKNMVCDRCIRVVRDELERLGLDVRSISLGEVILGAASGEPDIPAIRHVLADNGFELLDDRNTQLIERVKVSVLKLVRQYDPEHPWDENDSEFIAREAGHEYHLLSTLFSSTQGITIEKFIILQKIEFVKELLRYNELTLSEIAYQLGYSSVSHLSNQFKKTTGLSASEYRLRDESGRRSLDKIR